jgi:hypothetical protein
MRIRSSLSYLVFSGAAITNSSMNGGAVHLPGGAFPDDVFVKIIRK